MWKKKLLISINSFITTTFSVLASLHDHFDTSTNSIYRGIDVFIIAWCCFIVITSVIKFLMFKSLLVDKRLLTLFKLIEIPKVDKSGELYYGMVIFAIAIPLVWRIYLHLDIEHLTNLKEVKKLVKFFKTGPVYDNEQLKVASSFYSSHNNNEKGWRRRRRRMEEGAGYELPDDYMKIMEFYIEQQKRCLDCCKEHTFNCHSCRSLLTRRLQQNKDNTINGDDEIIMNPFINFEDYLAENSTQRWYFIAKRVYSGLLLILMIGLPLIYRSIDALKEVAKNSFTKNYDNYLLDNILLIYTKCEQVFCLFQGAIFLVYTNFFILIFKGDLEYKSIPIDRLLTKQVSKTYMERAEDGTEAGADDVKKTKIEILTIQTLMYRFFKTITEMDKLMSRCSIMCLLTVLPNLYTTYEYFELDNIIIKTGALANLINKFVSFTILCYTSWRVEQIVSF